MTEPKVIFDDVSDAKSPKEAAERTQAALQDLAEQIGYNPDDVMLSSPTAGHNAYEVTWEGLYEWTMALSGGRSAVNHDLGIPGGKPEVWGIDSTDGFIAEPINGCVLGFYPN